MPTRLLVAATLSAVVLPGLTALAAPSDARTPMGTTAGATTVAAPGAGDNATVTVSRTRNLVNQTVQVSWAGFRPSSAVRLQNGGDSLDGNTEDPVRVYECRGADPASSSDCYGSPGFRGIPATPTTPAYPAVPPFTYPGQTNPYDATPDGPANWQDNVTGPDGTGQVTIQVFTKRESAGLGCDAGSPCSIVVVPNYGRPQGDTEDLMDAPWAWERRTVVPLTFRSVEGACPIGGTSLPVEGSPISAGLLASWRSRTCTLAGDAVSLDYTSIGEPQTRLDVASGSTPVGLVTDPLDADAANAAGIVYSPVSVTGLVVAFQVDDVHGQPVTHMNLDARLVAKLVTASYRTGADPAVLHNPVDLFRDPEFLKLNPGIDWPGGSPGNHPLLLGDLSDTTLALTRWIWHDPAARAFLQGKPDPWGMTVNSNYRKVAMPFAAFPLLDESQSTSFQPIQGMDALSRQLSIAQFPGAVVNVIDGQNVTSKFPRQNPGGREVIGIVDAADAARFLLPTASLQNSGGAFVAPTTASLTDGIRHSTVHADGVTREVDLDSTDKGVYPLTMLVSAALSSQADKATRARMADLLDYVAGPGQVPGDGAGRLPAGHVPLTDALRRQVLTARAAVLAGPRAEPSSDPSPSDGPTTSSSDTPGLGRPGPPVSPDELSLGAAPGAGANPSDAPTDTPGGTVTEAGAAPAMATVASQTPGHRLLTLPGLLVLALAGLLAGPLVLWLERTGRGPAWLRR